MKLFTTISIVLLLGVAQFTFSQTTCFEADNNYIFKGGNSAKSIAKGDFNGDNKLDIIMGNALGGNDASDERLYYIQNNGEGTFLDPVEIMSGSQVYDVAVGDFNGDQNLDVVVVNFNMERIAILFGNGDGTFQAPVAYPTDPGPTAIAVGDIDGDGELDIAVITNNSTLNIFLNDANSLGTMLPQAVIVLTASSNPSGITMADFDSNQNMDIAISNKGLGSTSVYYGDGTGGFTFNSEIPTGSDPTDIVSDDFNGDNKPDLAVVNSLSNTVSVLLNNGSGTFASAVDYAVGEFPISIETGDFDGDNIRDLAIVNSIDNTMSTLKGRADGTFSPHVSFYATNSPQDLVVGDFNDDNNDDVIHSCLVGEVMPVYFGFGDGDFELGNMVQVGDSPRDITTGNFTNGGNQDLAVVNYEDNTVSIHSNDGYGNYTFEEDLTTGNNPSSIVSGDFNGNLNEDIVVANYTDGTIGMYFNTAGTFAAPVIVSIDAHPIKIRKGDFNSDGKLDLFILHEGDQVTVLPGVGDGTFSTPIVITTGSQPRGIAVGKVNADAHDDFVISLFGEDEIVVYESDGASGFSISSTINTLLQPAQKIVGPTTIELADLNGDGRPEIIVASPTSNKIKRYINNGLGVFNVLSSRTYSASDTGPLDITSGDFNGDGHIDIAVTNIVSVGSTGNVVFFIGDGTGNLTFDNRYTVGNNPVAIIATDLDNNGSLDLAIVNEQSDYVSIMRSSVSTPVISADGPTTICGSGSVTLTSTSAAAYLWSNGATSRSITVSAAGNYSVTTSAPGGGCSTISNVISVDNLPSPVLAFSGATDFCAGESTSITVSGADSYVWSDGLGTNASQNLSPSSNKTYEVVGTTGGCTDTLEIPIVINPLPDATFTSLSSQYCQASGSVTLEANTPLPGGAFSGDGVTGNTFDPSNAGVGTKTITYSVADANGCTNSSAQTVEVTAGGVDASFTTLASSYCEEDPVVTLVPTVPGGYFGGDVVSGNIFDPSEKSGLITITYTINSGGCSGSTSQSVNVVEMPDADFSGLDSEYCLNDPIAELTPDGGIGSITGPGMNSNDFDPNTAGVGTHIITCTVTVDGCTSVETETIEVLPIPDATFNGLNSAYCVDETNAVTLSATQTGGNFTITPGIGISGNTFTPSIAGVGLHTITYTIEDGGCTATTSQNVEVKAVPNASFTVPSLEYCLNETSVPLSAVESSGSFSASGSGISGTIFNPSLAGVGSHTITYIITANGCTKTSSQIIKVNAIPDPSFNGVAASYCISDLSVITLNPIVSGGTFSASGNGLSGNSFTPSVAGIGTHRIVYVVEENGCTDSTFQNVTINSLPDASFTGLGSDYCIDETSVTLSPADSDGSFTGPGTTTGSFVFNPNSAGAGNKTITYSITDGNGCTASTSHSTIVNDAYPDATFSNLSGPYCVNNAPITVSPNGPSGILGGNGVTNFDFDPSIAGLGTHKVYHTVTGTNTCTSSDTVSVVVTAAPVATFTGIASDYCIDDLSVITLSATQSGGDFTASGNGLSGNSFTPIVAGVGSHTITYDIELGGCTASETQTVEVNALPSLTFNALSDLCENDGVLNLSASPNGGTFSGPGIAASPLFDPSAAGEGTHVITYQYTDANNCSASTVQSITVNAIPDPSFNGVAASYCISDLSVITLNPIVSGGTFSASGNGLSGNSFTPSVAGIGTHRIVYVVEENGCTDSTFQNVTINSLPDASFTGLGSDYCIDETSVTLSPADSDGTFNGPGTTTGSFVFNPNSAGAGNKTIIYSITDGNGCTASTSHSTIVNDAYPDATFSNLSGPYCVNNAPITVSPNGPSGILGGNGVSSFDFDPSIAGLGTHKVYHTVTGTNTCTSSDTVSVVVTAAPVATFTGIASDYCIDDLSVITLSATQSGGDFTASGNGLSGNSFTPSVAGAGTHTITYDIELNGCTASASQAVNVNALPVLTFNALSDLCENDGVLNLSATPNGGTFSGPGISASPTFDPSVAGEGTHTIEYEFTDANNCSASTVQSITVKPLPVATFTGLNSTYCADAASVPLTGTVPGGVFSGPGISGSPFTFNPTIAGANTHTITYTPPALNGCTNSSSQTVVVTPLSNALFSGLGVSYCADAASVTLTPSQTGGTFTGPGTTLGSSVFDPSVAGSGSHTITYTINDGNGCTATTSQPTVVSNVYPDATFSNLAGPYCVNNAPITVSPNGPIGILGGTGVTNFDFDPSIAGPGTHKVYHTVTGTNTCTSSDTVSVVVTAAPVATFTGIASNYCIDDLSVVTLSATESGGDFTASGNGLSGNSFTPSDAGVGTHTITYDIELNGCTASASQAVNVNALPILTFNALSDLCKNNSALNLSATPNGGTFSGPGISASPTFDPSVAGEGTHTIEYEFTDANNCSANVSQSIVVNALPNVTLSGFDPTYCIDADSVVLEGLPIGGDFTVSGMTTNTFNPAIVGEGTHIVDYEYTDGNNCSVTVSENIVVHPLPNVNFTGLSNVVCENASALILTANLDGGTFNGPGMVDSIFNPSIAGAGTHTITYTAADGNGCSNSYSKMIQVNHDIDASFTGLNGSYCSADTSTIALIPNIPGGTFTGSGVSGNSWSPNDANVGNNTIVYEVSNVNCANSFNSVVNVLLSPNANFTALENVYCNNEAPINIVPNQSGGVLTATSGLSSSTFYPQIATIGTNIVTYSITSGNGCSNSSSDTLEVVSAPHSTITVEDTTLIADVVGGNITYQWINCNNQTPIVGENQQVSHVGKNGTYSVVVYDGMCRDTSDCVVVYFADLTAYLDENSINVYPNPNTGQFTVETKFDVKVEIINSIGKLVYKDEHFKGKNVVNLGSSIETGMYIVKFTDGNGNFGYKNIVVRN